MSIRKYLKKTKIKMLTLYNQRLGNINDKINPQKIDYTRKSTEEKNPRKLVKKEDIIQGSGDLIFRGGLRLAIRNWCSKC